MSSDLITAGLFAVTALLAVGFHRHRAAQIALLLMLLSIGAGSLDQRLQEGALRFAPLLILIAASVPEARLLSRRHAVFVLVLALLLGTTLDAPYSLFHSMASAAAGPFGSWRPEASAGLVLAIAGMVCLARWVLRGASMELGCSLALLIAGLACAATAIGHAALMLSAGLILFAILYSGYRMAFLDQLTGLPNRRALDETLGRLSGNYALAMLDVDHFKSFNDSHGHDAGDVVLRDVAAQLRRHAGGTSFRYGGEEFCVVYPGRRALSASEHLEAVRVAIEARRIAIRPSASASATGKAKRREVSVTISAGCAQRDERRRAAHEVLKAADQALYRAKKKGRNQVVAG